MSEVAPAPGTAQVPVAVVIGQSPVALGDVSAQYVEPSKTIFARGLAPALSEFEFIHLFQKHPGFISARVKKNRDGSPIGFAEFDTIEHSVAAKEAVAQERAGTDLVLEYSHTSRRNNRHRHVPFPSCLCSIVLSISTLVFFRHCLCFFQHSHRSRNPSSTRSR